MNLRWWRPWRRFLIHLACAGWLPVRFRDWLAEYLYPDDALISFLPRWTGPYASDLKPDGATLLHPVPPERWPYGLPGDHQDCCSLHRGGLVCDCWASAEEISEDEWA